MVGLLQQSSCLLQGVHIDIGPVVPGDEVVGSNRLILALSLEPLLVIAEVILHEAYVSQALGLGSIDLLLHIPIHM